MEAAVSRGAMLRERADLLTEEDVAAMVDVDVRTVQNWRHTDDGPAWVKVGRSAFYRFEAVKKWIASREQRGR